MRRTAALVSAVALVATGVALAAPAGAAALKPGVPTAVKAVPTTKGTATVTWKAPVVKKGKSAKATSYTVVCSGAKKVTVKTTKATVTLIKTGYKDGVSCLVSATAGKAVGKAAKSNAFTAYVQIGTATFNLTPAAMTGLNNALNALAPARLVKAADGSGTMTFPVTAKDANGPTRLAGGFVVGKPGVVPPVNKLTVVADATSTPMAPVYDIAGYVSVVSKQLPILIADTFTDATHFSVHLTKDPTLNAVLPQFGITLAGGADLGTGTFQ